MTSMWFRAPPVFLVLSLVCSSFFGNIQNNDASQPRKFDEFGDAQYSDIAARLDNFAIQLQNDPAMRGFVIAYRSRRDLPGLSSRLVHWLKDYLIHSRGLPPERIVAIDGGESNCVTQELWLVPPGATIKPRADAYESLIDTSYARLFDEGPFYGKDDYPESYTGHISHSLEGFSDALRKEPRTSGYVIGYATYRIDTWENTDERGRTITERRVIHDSPSVARKALTDVKKILVNDLKIPASKIKLMYGGYRTGRVIELWIVPLGAMPPVPTPNSFPKRRR